MRKSPARDSYQALSSTAFDIGETRQCTAKFAALIEFWKMDLGAFTGRGQGGPCLTDAAQ
jgi:hypothetical protein